MLKKVGLVSLLGFACTGCSLGTYVLATQAIVNTSLIGLGIAGGTALESLGDLLAGLGINI